MKNSQRITPKIPDGMVELMKNLAKSVLKEQPENIYVFAAEYFENLVRERDGSLNKGYSTFRKYDNENIKQNGVEVCPRCNCILHPERKNEEAIDDDTSPRIDDENPLDMSVNGVAIKAVPRDNGGGGGGKSSKGTKNRQRLETIRSVSMDSAIEDDGKSISPKSNEKTQEKTLKSQNGLSNLNLLNVPGTIAGAQILNQIDENKAHESMANYENNDNIEKSIVNNEKDEPIDLIEKDVITELPINETIVEPISTNKFDDDVPDTPTNDTSVSETITDRTVIEVAPYNAELKNDELKNDEFNASDSTQVDEQSNTDKKPDDMEDTQVDTIPTVVMQPTEEQNTTNDNVIKSVEPVNLPLEQVKQMDRLRTPESDSGLSEKSFNLNIQENEEAVTNEVNETKDSIYTERKPDEKLLNVNENEFDTTSKDDSGIVDMYENQSNFDLNNEQELSTSNKEHELQMNENQSSKKKGDIKAEPASLTEEENKATDNTPNEAKNDEIDNSIENSHKPDPNDVNADKSENDLATNDIVKTEKSEEIAKAIEKGKPEQSDALNKTTEDVVMPMMSENKKENEPKSDDLNENKDQSMDGKVSDSKQMSPSESKNNILADNKDEKIKPEVLSAKLKHDSTSNLPAQINGQNQSPTAQSTPENTVSNESGKPLSEKSHSDVKDEPNLIKEDAKQVEKNTSQSDLDATEKALKSEENTKEPSLNRLDTPDDIKKESITNDPKMSSDDKLKDNKSIETVPETSSQAASDQTEEKIDQNSPNTTANENKSSTDQNDGPALSESNQDDNKTETSQQPEKVDEKPNQASIEKKVKEVKNEEIPMKSIANLSAISKIDDKKPDETNIEENLPKNDTKSESQPENNADHDTSEMRNDLDIKNEKEEPSNGNAMEEENGKRDKRQADAGANQTENVDEKPTKAPIQEGKLQLSTDYDTTKPNDDKSETSKTEVDSNRTFPESENIAAKIDKQPDESENKDKPVENISQSQSEVIALAQDVQENVQKTSEIPSVVETKGEISSEEKSNNNDIRPTTVASDKKLSSEKKLESEPNSVSLSENKKNIESIVPTGSNDKTDKTATEKIAEQVTDQDANQRKMSVSPLTGDTEKDVIVDSVSLKQPEVQAIESSVIENASPTDSKYMSPTKTSDEHIDPEKRVEIDIENEKSTKNEQNNDTCAASKPDSPVKSDADKPQNETPSQNVNESIDENKSIQASESTEKDSNEQTKNDDTEIIADIKNTSEKSLNANKIDAENENENKFENDKPSNENDGRRHSVTENDQIKQKVRNESDQFETKLDLTENDETDDVYSTPPDTTINDRTSVSHEQSAEIDTKPKTHDKSDDVMQNIANESSALNENSANVNEGMENISENKNKKNGIEANSHRAPKQEESRLVDEVKVNETTNSEGVNECSAKMSTMPPNETSVDETDNKIIPDKKTNENGNIEDTNEKLPNIIVDQKTVNETDAGSDGETKNNNEDVASELSASARDDYEQAETEAIGDESVKDLDLSSNHDFEPNQANESAESEQQITALEIQPHNDNDSIESPKQNQMQPDSLDILIDSLDASLEPSVDADSLNIDSLDDKPRSAKSTDTGKRKDSIDGIIEEDPHPIQETTIKMEPSEPKATDDSNNSFQLEVPNENRNTLDEQSKSPAKTAKGEAIIQNELKILQVIDQPAAIQKLEIAKDISPAIKKQDEVISSEVISNEDENKTELAEISVIEQKSDIAQNDAKTEIQSATNEKISETKDQATSITESANETNSSALTEDQTEQSFDLNSTTIDSSETQTTSDEIVEVVEVVEVVEIVEKIKCIDYPKSSHDIPSSDLSDTDTTDKADGKAYTESGVDETSRDEQDEVSEIENFDLSSCGEDSLEAMYYMIRKNEIIMDRHKQSGAKKCDDDKITFPEKVTDDLEHAVHEVSGKKSKLCSIGSIDDVVLKKMSSDSDEIQLHVIPNSENDMSSSDQKSCPLKEQCTANESTDDEYINPIVDSMQKNEDTLNEMHAKALSVQPNRIDAHYDVQQLETDTFNEHSMDIDMVPGNIERKILASSVSEADSDYFELPPTNAVNRLTKDDFNVSTAFEHMIRTESTTEDSDSTIESAATKIQAGARGFLARRRIRKSSAGTSTSNEKHSSIGNAAIDKSLDNLVEQHEMMEENAYTESMEETSPKTHYTIDSQTIDSIDSDKILGITEVKVEQRKDESNATEYTGNTIDVSNDEKVPEINIQGTSDSESATAQRRAQLQRGDALQRNSTPESSEQQIDKEKSNTEPTNKEENNNQNEQNKHDNDTKIDTPLANASKPISKPLRGLGPRQRSMPVQIDSQLIRVLPKHKKKRVKSANSNAKNLRSFFF